MKKQTLALAIAAALPALALADGPTLYGKLDVTLDEVKTDTGVPGTSTNVWQLNSNASRFGVKGDADTGTQDIKGVYLLEYGTYVDDGDDKGLVFTQRNIYAGLKGDFGQVRAGKFDTPLKEAQGKFDEFNDLAGDIQNVLPGEVRASNIVAYNTPKFLDALTFTLAVIPAEGVDIDNTDGDKNTATDGEDTLADSYSTSLVYDKDAIYAAIAYDNHVTTDSDKSVDGFTDIDGAAATKLYVQNITRAVVQYRADAFEVGALYQSAEDASDGADKADTAWVVSGAYKNDKWKFKGQYGHGEGDAGKVKTLTAAGVDYALGKATTVFAYYTDVATDNVGAAVDTAVTTYGLGLDQKF